MVSRQQRMIAAALSARAPAWVLDQDRIVTQANLLMFWTFGILRIGDPCDPGVFLGRHSYDVLARAVEEGRLSPWDEANEHYFLARLQAIIGKPDEPLPGPQRFLKLVLATRGGEQWWQEMIAGYGGFGDPLALKEVHYPVVVTPPDGPRLEFLATIDRFDDGTRLISYAPQGTDTAWAIRWAYNQILQVYPDADYVQDVRNLTVFHPVEDNDVDNVDDVDEIYKLYDIFGRYLPMSPESHPSKVWRPDSEFRPEPISEAFNHREPIEIEHPLDGSGFAWELAAGLVEPTRFELFPERRVVKLRFTDGAGESQKREYALDYLTVEQSAAGQRVVILSAHGGRASLLRVYPTGEFDESFRFVSAEQGLPPEAVIWSADQKSLPTAGAERPPLTAAEAAERLGSAPEYVKQMIRAGRLPGFKRSGVWFVPAAALDEYQRRRRTK